MFKFTCNICSAPCSIASKEALGREEKSCSSCGSTVRFRWIVHALSRQLFGVSIPLKFFPVDKSVSGIGMSDWHVMAEELSSRLTFRNTHYHAEPRFDLLRPAAQELGAYDFVIASEVFEHIAPPVERAFTNLARVLRPNGFVVFSVPWKPEGATEEHFPNLHDWHVVEGETQPVLVNRTSSGTVEQFENLVFHGGPGQTLEMRLFSKESLVDCFKQAGFSQVVFSELDEKPCYGIVWQSNWSLGLVAYKGTTRRRVWRLPLWKARIRWLLLQKANWAADGRG